MVLSSSTYEPHRRRAVPCCLTWVGRRGHSRPSQILWRTSSTASSTSARTIWRTRRERLDGR
eukprot:3107319-Prymnesium_polylepis.1